MGSVPLPSASGQDRLIVRVVAGLSGVLGAGTLLLGGVMLVIMVVLGIRDGQTNDLVVTTGPGWSRTWVQLTGGLACEALNWGVRRQRSPVVRVIAGLTGIASALAVLWWVWWR